MKSALLKMMFYRRGRLFMPYVYAFMFLKMIYIYMWVRLLSPLGSADKINISDVLMSILFAEVIAFIKISTWGQKDIYYDGEEKRNQ
ncbi:MAG: hypothetical protein M0P71_17800 [Melioribacteraceae bacterium]|jgi:hypothetical protein|nr:hypothetical protein [Melioribacteraceae bacterium]